MPDPVLYEVDVVSHVATITLNRPEASNALSMAVLDGLDRAMTGIEQNCDARVVMLTGGDVFCAGMDLGEIQADEGTVRRLLMRLSQVMRRFGRLPMPTIAVVETAAIGGGFGLLCAADFVITHADARIGYPPPETGLSAAVMAPWLARRIGAGPALSMLLAGGTISGDTAHARGIVSHLADRDSLGQVARDVVTQLAAGDPHANARTKRFMLEHDPWLRDTVLDEAAELSAAIVASPETQQRLSDLLART